LFSPTLSIPGTAASLIIHPDHSRSIATALEMLSLVQLLAKVFPNRDQSYRSLTVQDTLTSESIPSEECSQPDARNPSSPSVPLPTLLARANRPCPFFDILSVGILQCFAAILGTLCEMVTALVHDIRSSHLLGYASIYSHSILRPSGLLTNGFRRDVSLSGFRLA
jgi:hypothetical protein